ncbi:MAG: hypothetical protein WEG36_00115 [Gemmatimonadota bacterium]
MRRVEEVALKLALPFGLALLGGFLFASPAAGQQGQPPGQPQFFPADSIFLPRTGTDAAEPVTPRGAFLRALVIPGWGHVATRTYTRGGFYVAAQSGGLWMLGTAMRRRSDARSLVRVERMAVRSRLEAMGMSHPDSLSAAIAADPAVRSWEVLEESRGQQVEDWAAVSIFLVLLGAADAFVSAHLMDFPEPLALQAVPAGPSGGVELTLSLPLGRRPSGSRGR